MLLLQSQISELEGPSSRVLSTFRHYLEGRALTIPLPLIGGRAQRFLDEEKDLVALRKPTDEDALSKFLLNHWPGAFQKRKSSDPLDRTTTYKTHHVTKTVAAMSMTVAYVLLVSAIITLHVVTGSTKKLGFLAMYILLFASSIAFVTNAKRGEVFAATAAYAAVLVVFIGGGDLGESKEQQCLIQLENGVFKMVQCPG